MGGRRSDRTPQQRALAHVAARSRGGPLEPDLRISLNFHPDREQTGRPVLEALLREGAYRSQFETGTSNGGLTAHPGGDRWWWESRMFGGAYDAVPAAERPKYGALNFRHSPAGAAPRFGSAHLRLSRECLARTTFCFPDSVFEPVDFGTADRMALIELAREHGLDPLDDYVEAHVHGPVRPEQDVEALVLDPCFRGTEVHELARELPCRVEWHHGFRLSTEELHRHPDYRGTEVVDPGLEVAVGGRIDARTIGRAARAGQDEQLLKRLWHCVVRFGALPPAGSGCDIPGGSAERITSR